MQLAIIAAQCALYAAVLVPFFSDKILELRGIAVGVRGWLLALIGPVGCLVLCEICKILTAYQKRKQQEKLALQQQADEEDQGKELVRKVSSVRRVRSKSAVRHLPEAEPAGPELKVPPASSKRSSKGMCRCLGLYTA